MPCTKIDITLKYVGISPIKQEEYHISIVKVDWTKMCGLPKFINWIRAL